MRHPGGPHDGQRHAHALRARGDGLPRHAEGHRVCEIPHAKDRRGHRGGECGAATGPHRLGLVRRLGAHAQPPLDSPARQGGRRSLRPADGPCEHAPRLPQQGRRRPQRPRRSAAQRHRAANARWQTTRCARELLAALLWHRRGLRRLLRPLLQAPRRQTGPARRWQRPLRLRHEPGHQRRSDVDGLWRGEKNDHHRPLRLRGRRQRAEGPANRQACRSRPARHDREDARAQVSRSRRTTPCLGEAHRREDQE